MALPMWLVAMLRRAMPALLAEDAMLRASAGRVATADKRHFEQAMNRWDKQARPVPEGYHPGIMPATAEVRQWFIDNGIRIVEA